MRVVAVPLIVSNAAGVIQSAAFVGWSGRCPSGTNRDLVNQRSNGFQCTPVPPGRCVFVDNLILPDRCISSCRSGVDCSTTKTRPYFVFWTEDAGCPDGVICE